MKSIGKRVGLALLILFVVMGLVEFAKMQGVKSEKQQVVEQKKASGLNIWYTNDQLSPYLEAASEEYQKKYGVQIHCNLVDSNDYVKNIYTASVSGDAAMPDLFLLRNDKLESVWMSGLTTSSKKLNKVCTKDNFSQTALNAVTYQGKYAAYPLSFDTVCMVYNKDVFAQPPATMDELVSFADNGQVPENTEKILYWNADDYFCNYAFLANELDLMGSAGDNVKKYSVASDDAVKVLHSYHAISQYFAVNQADVSDDAVVKGFLDHKTLSILADTSMLAKIEQAKQSGSTTVNYGIAKVPDISGELKTVSPSYTNCVVVNGLSANQELASDFAKYLTLTYSDKLYETSGQLSAKKGISYSDEEMNHAQEVYEKSKQFSKLLVMEDIWMKLDVLFSNVADGKEVGLEFANFNTQIEERLH